MIREHGAFSRTKLFADGIRAFVAVRDRNDGRFDDTLARVSPFVDFPLAELYKRLNEAEGTTTGPDKWGGSDIVGGSPRLGGSGLSPTAVEEIVEGAVRAVGEALTRRLCQRERRR